MIWVRSLAFSVLAGAWTGAMMILFLPLLMLPPTAMQRAVRFWCRGLLSLARRLCGLRYRVVGREHLPAGSVIIAAKHQSAWDTLIFHLLVANPIYVLKKELISVPFIGWYMRHAGNIPVDRKAGGRALKGMLPPIAAALTQGAQIIIFPEGTRVAPGDHRPYLPGIAALYAHATAPVVPVALNSGLFWGRRSFLKYPGCITLQILPAIKPGLTRGDFLATLEREIETAVDRLSMSQPEDEDTRKISTAAVAADEARHSPIR